ncbi:RDD family protein [Ferrovum sp.]|uniref:RDD family protein n=1 Tax=Ferrovum sp. TaxID=2609467 RepID=UPI002616122D|nr:RDD family protein [Ferrovum sp.]
MTAGPWTRLPLRPRLISWVYEVFLVAGVLIAATLPFVRLTHYALHPEWREWYRLYLFGVVGFYFSWFWHRSGQTIPMRTWHLQLLDSTGHPPSWGKAFLRYVLAIPGYLTGISLLWVLVDKEGQFLHDRLLGLTMRQY